MNQKIKYLVGIGIAVLLMVGLFVVLQNGSGELQNEPGDVVDNTTSKDISFRLKWKYNGTSCGAMLAHYNKFFEKEGLTVKIEQGGFELDSKKMVVAGKDQIGLTGADELILAIANGMPLIAIGADFQRTPCAIFALKSSGIETPADFAGKRLGIRKSLNTEFQYIALMKHEQLDRSKVHEEPLKFDMTRVREGHLDMWTSYLTFAQIEGRDLDINTIQFSDYGVNSYGNVLFTTRKFAEENPEIVRAFLKAYYQGWAWGMENPDKVAEIIKTFNPEADLDIEKETFALAVPLLETDDGSPLGSMTRDMWLSTMQVLIDADILEKKLDVDNIYTNEYLVKK